MHWHMAIMFQFANQDFNERLFNVFPNPATDKIHVVGEQTKEINRCEIIDRSEKVLLNVIFTIPLTYHI